MNFFKTILLFMCGLQYVTQVGAQKEKIFSCPPYSVLTIMAKHYEDVNFNTKYGISKKRFIKIVEDLQDYSAGTTISLKVGSKTYYVNDEQCNQINYEFRERPGDCGWIPRFIIYHYMPGKEKEAIEYIKNNKYKVWAIVETEKGKFENKEIPVEKSREYFQGKDHKQYFIGCILVAAMEEEKTIRLMKSSGLFLYVSRDGVPCGSFYSRLVVKKKFLFGNNKPERIMGVNFLNRFFNTELKSKSKVDVKPVTDFTYDITILGQSKFLSLKKDFLWEKFNFTIFFQNGFNLKPDEMEIMVQFNSFEAAKSPVENMAPTSARFTEYKQYAAPDSKAVASEFAQDIFIEMANKCKGQILNNNTSFE